MERSSRGIPLGDPGFAFRNGGSPIHNRSIISALPLCDTVKRGADWLEWLSLNEGDVQQALRSLGDCAVIPGRLLCDREILRRAYSRDPRALKRVERAEEVRARIVEDFERDRAAGAFLLSGYRSPSLKRTRIPNDLAVTFDFAGGSARCGAFEFHSITVRRTDAGAVGFTAPKPGSLTPVSDRDLTAFSDEYAKRNCGPASQAALYQAAKAHFADHIVTRVRVRERHRILWPGAKPGPRRNSR